MIFVDTGAWYASVVPSDPDYSAASAWLATNTEPLLTTNYVIDETLTLLRARGERTRSLWLGENVKLESIDPANTRTKKPEILEEHGRAPQQYLNPDDWDEDDEDE